MSSSRLLKMCALGTSLDGGCLVTVDIYGRINPVETSASAWEKTPIPKSISENNFPLYERSNQNELVYEFRSGRLIMGTMDKAYSFVPKAGKPVITLDEFMQSPDFTPRSSSRTRLMDFENKYGKLRPGEPVIYNLPGLFVRKRDYPQAVPVKHPKLPTIEKKSSQPGEGKHVFVQDDKKMFLMRMGENYYDGYIALPSGIFAPKHLNKPIKPDELREYQLPHLMTPTALNEPVYEFRHGTLIPGFILMDYRGDFLFVPEEGAKTIEAAPYLKTYAPSFRRIYNLPGKFVKEGPEKK